MKGFFKHRFKLLTAFDFFDRKGKREKLNIDFKIK